MSDDRGSGRTTRQMQKAPTDAVYIVATSREVWHARQLAHHLGRTDLEIQPAIWLARNEGRRGYVVLDHFVDTSQLTYWERGALEVLRIRGFAE